MSNASEHLNPQQLAKNRLGNDFDTTLTTVKADKHIQIANSLELLKSIEHRLDAVLDRVQAKPMNLPRGIEKTLPCEVEPPQVITSLMMILDTTPERLEDHRNYCIDKLTELETILFGNRR